MAEKKKPSLAVDIVVFTILNNELHILLIERKYDPFKNMFALPGGFMKYGETCEQTAARELFEETGIRGIPLKFFGVFSNPARDPRTHVVSIPHVGIVRADTVNPKGGDDAKSAQWVSMKKLPKLATDHLEMIKEAREFLKEKQGKGFWFGALLPDNAIHKDKENLSELLEKFKDKLDA